MNRKPHMIITKNKDGIQIGLAEVRFDAYSAGTTILYKETGCTQHLSLESSLYQSIECPIQGQTHCWQPLGPSRTVLELIDNDGKRIALYNYTNDVGLTAIMGVGKNSPSKDIGELHILEDIEGGPRATEEVLCSALTVVERARRRASNVKNVGSNSKQGAFCGLTANTYGGGL